MESEWVFVDTSAFYALMDRSDSNYEQAAGLWATLLEKDLYLCTGNYVIVETLSLLQSHLGFEAANLWYRDVLSLAEILWIDRSMHNLAYELWLSLGRRKLSFVDCVSFMAMRHYKVEKVFGFDRHFVEQGFEIVSEES
ncbi:MAG: PIN domain-containing protein [Deltaproteobacteria bacterium]|nr:PIN domain-containing protein [Deltaproteobacteria bacterium]MBW2169210.1 PIN domain-containing protein [Deltaproteobacteria bacterium]